MDETLILVDILVQSFGVMQFCYYLANSIWNNWWKKWTYNTNHTFKILTCTHSKVDTLKRRTVLK